MKKKILILGGAGMLGWQITNALSRIYSNCSVTVSNSKSSKILKDKLNKKLNIIIFDVLNYKKNDLKKLIKNHDIIINCIGLIKPYINDFKSEDVIKAIKINSEFPIMINNLIKNTNIKVYQIATDCVFSGNSKFYRENSKHDCEDVYGKTKSLGEIYAKNFFNIRCSIIGEEIKNHRSLISWFLSNQTGSKINGFVNHKWNGLTTNAFAEIIKTIIVHDIKLPNLTHIIPKNAISKFKLLIILNQKYNRNLKVNKFVSDLSINRTLGTNNKNLNKLIWKKSNFKTIPTIENMIKAI